MTMSRGERTTPDATTLRAEARTTSGPCGRCGAVRSSAALSASYDAILAAHAGIIENAAGPTPRYRARAESCERRSPVADEPCCCIMVLIVSTGWNVTVATHAAAPPATAERRKDVSRDSDTAWHGAALDRRRESASRLAEGVADLESAVLKASSTTQRLRHRTTITSERGHTGTDGLDFRYISCDCW